MAFGLGGESVGRAFVSLHANGDDVPDDISDALDKMTPRFQKAGADHSKAYAEWFDRESKKSSRKSADAFLSGFRDELAKGLKGFDKTKTAAAQLELGLKRIKLVTEENDRSTRNWLGHFHSKLGQVNRTLDESATRIGRMFGKGSRNDFLNILGRSVEGLTRVVFLVPKMAEGLAGIFSGKGGGGGLANMVTGGLASFLALSVALSAIVLVLGPIAALISGVSAALIGLVGSAVIATGAIGGVALALSGPLIVGIGVAALALTHLDKKTKDALSGIGDSFTELGKSAGEAIGPGLRKAADNLAPAIGKLAPLVDSVAESLGRVAVGWSDAIGGPSFDRFRDAIGSFVPGAIERIGAAVGGLVAGVGGVLRAAIPIANEFLDWIVKIADRFNEWANSRAGQRELKSFFRDAADSAKAIGGFIEDAVVATGHLLSAGKDSGDALFTKLGDKLREFTNYLTDPKNKEAISSFFDNGVKVAENLGQLVLDIADVIDTYDTKQSRKELDKLFTTVGKVLELVEDLHDVWTLLGEAATVALKVTFDDGGVIDTLQKFRDFSNTYLDAGRPRDLFGIGKGIDWIIGKIQDFWGYLKDNPVTNKLREWLRGSGSAISAKSIKLPKINVMDLFEGIGSATAAVRGFFAGAASASRKMWADMRDGASRTVDSIAAFFGKLPGRISGAVNGLWSQIRGHFQGVVDGVGGIVDDIAGAFQGLAGRILSAIGTIDIGSLIDIPSPGGGVPFVPGVASGGLFGKVTTGPQLRWVGEDGPEAIVPLNRPLGQVDPSVRALSAIAQGLAAPAGKTIDASRWTIVTQGPNPYAVAREVVNDFAAKALF